MSATLITAFARDPNYKPVYCDTNAVLSVLLMTMLGMPHCPHIIMGALWQGLHEYVPSLFLVI